jgi:methanogenic corrinoid protein MtbC1
VSTIPAFASSLLRASARAYAVAAVARLRLERPELLDRGLPAAFALPNDDVEVRLLQLAASVEFDRAALIEHAAAWYKVAFHHRGVHAEYLPASLQAMQAMLGEELPPAPAAIVRRHLQFAIDAVARAPVELPSTLDTKAPHGRLAAQFLMSILEGRGDDALDSLRAAIDGGLSVGDAQDLVLAPVQREAGRMWLMAEIPIADEHYGSAIVERALAMLQERLPRPAADAPVVATMGVAGNLHDLGIRMVAQRLQAAGYRVLHLGGNLPAADLEWAFTDRRIDLVAMSATMTLHLHELAGSIATLRRFTHGRVPVLVGGDPFRLVEDLGARVGADAAAGDAKGAVEMARRLLGR